MLTKLIQAAIATFTLYLLMGLSAPPNQTTSTMSDSILQPTALPYRTLELGFLPRINQ